jgi:hypothetical protein
VRERRQVGDDTAGNDARGFAIGQSGNGRSESGIRVELAAHVDVSPTLAIILERMTS